MGAFCLVLIIAPFFYFNNSRVQGIGGGGGIVLEGDELILDQSIDPGWFDENHKGLNIRDTQKVAQLFKPSYDNIARMEFAFRQSVKFKSTFELEIVDFMDDYRSIYKGSGTFTERSGRAGYDFNPPLSVIPENTYAVYLDSSSPLLSWEMYGDNLYPRGYAIILGRAQPREVSLSLFTYAVNPLANVEFGEVIFELEQEEVENQREVQDQGEVEDQIKVDPAPAQVVDAVPDENQEERVRDEIRKITVAQDVEENQLDMEEEEKEEGEEEGEGILKEIVDNPVNIALFSLSLLLLIVVVVLSTYIYKSKKEKDVSKEIEGEATKKRKKKRVLTIVLASLFLISATAALAYYFQRERPVEEVEEELEVEEYPEFVEKDCAIFTVEEYEGISEWDLYYNESYGYRFKLPGDWEVTGGEDLVNGVGYINDEIVSFQVRADDMVAIGFSEYESTVEDVEIYCEDGTISSLSNEDQRITILGLDYEEIPYLFMFSYDASIEQEIEFLVDIFVRTIEFD